MGTLLTKRSPWCQCCCSPHWPGLRPIFLGYPLVTWLAGKSTIHYNIYICVCVWYAMIFPAINLHLVRDFLTSHLGLLEANSPQSTPSTNRRSGLASQESQAANNSQLEPPREWPAQTTLLRPCRRAVKQVCEAHYCDYWPSGLI